MLGIVALALAVAAGGAQAHENAVNCGNCKEWNQAQAPFRVVGNTWYVGVKGLSALLITGPQGHILLDGGLPQSAPLIEQNIKALGFRIEDVKLIVNSHAHWDHAGGIPALQRASGAVVAASPSSARGIKSGTNGPDDPQFEAHAVHIATLSKVQVVADGETLKVGPLSITAHMTPGHTPGSTSWSWTSCEGATCHAVVYADSLNPVSSDGFYFSGKGKSPDLSASFADSIAKVAALKCDVVVSVHPGFTNTLEKLAARTPEHNPFIDPDGCKVYAAVAAKSLAQRLATERAEKSAGAGR
ncbi:MAG: subclass B3 metallo-beta-lactamase [Pseudomonadota bacterium]